MSKFCHICFMFLLLRNKMLQSWGHRCISLLYYFLSLLHQTSHSSLHVCKYPQTIDSTVVYKFKIGVRTPSCIYPPTNWFHCSTPRRIWFACYIKVWFIHFNHFKVFCGYSTFIKSSVDTYLGLFTFFFWFNRQHCHEYSFISTWICSTVF